MPSYSSKGGTAIYVNKKFNIIERKNLNAQIEDYESVWVEIKNKFSKNIVTGASIDTRDTISKNLCAI